MSPAHAKKNSFSSSTHHPHTHTMQVRLDKFFAIKRIFEDKKEEEE
jgi:hypothetical protein